jgi:hypothetical protein
LCGIDEKNVARLQEIYRLEGCKRDNPENNVPVLVAENVLSATLHHSGLTVEDLHKVGQPPQLNLAGSTKLKCLHGRHRLEAAQRYLKRTENKWWIVDIFIDGNRPVLK